MVKLLMLLVVLFLVFVFLVYASLYGEQVWRDEYDDLIDNWETNPKGGDK